MTEINGVINNVRFHNAQNSYSILNVVVPGQKDEFGEMLKVTVVGAMPAPRPDMSCIFKGEWVEDRKWGKQFKLSSYEVLMPSDEQGIISYLSGISYGVGRAKARGLIAEIMAKYPGRNALEVLQENPEILKESKIINAAQVEEITNNIMQNATLAELSSLICGEGISPGLAMKVYMEYGQKAVEVVKDDPYLLADEVYGIGFKKADAIALRIGIKEDSQFRIKAAIAYVIKEAQSNGHCFLEPKHIVFGLREGRSVVVMGLQDLLGFLPDIPTVKMANEQLIRDSRCVRVGDAVYDFKLHEAEAGVAAHLLRLVGQKVDEIEDIDGLVNEAEETIRKQEPYFKEYAPEQRESVKMAIQNGICILTGGPGTGKSTQLNGIIKIYRKLFPHRPIYLCSPTGRAAKRMTETTGLEAKTIHRLLKYNPEFGGFNHNQNNQLSGPGLLAIDEASMMDIELANSLLQAIPEGVQVVFLGDIDQLPSVGPGSVLRDIIQSGAIPVVRLQYNYRQAAGSGIADYAYKICSGEWEPPNTEDIEWLRISDKLPAAEASGQTAIEVVKRVKQAVADGLGVMDFQVLAPQRKGAAGVNNLNSLIQDAINPKEKNKPELTFGKSIYRLNSKVMVTSNNYALGVFNGDLGIITAVVGREFRGTDAKGKETKGPGVFVDIDGEEVFFGMDDIGILDLAYASTIHKSQGSEFKLVIIVCVRSHFISLARNLVYTGITRARNNLTIIAQDSALKHAVDNSQVASRFSLLEQRLRGEIK